MTFQEPTDVLVFYDGAGDGGGGNAGGGDGGQPGGDGGSAGGAGGQPWYAALSDGLRANPNLTKYGTLEEFATGHINQVKLIGKDPSRLIELPDGDDAEARVKVLRQLGAPEAIEGYKLSPVEGLDETLSPEGALAKMFVGAAHKHALLPSQAQAIYADVAAGLHAAIKEDTEARETEQQQGLAALKEKWGPAFDQNVAALRFAVEKVGGEALKKRFEDYGLENDPVFAEAFAQIGKLMAEDNAGGGEGAGRFNQVLAPAEAEAKGNDLLQQALQSKDMHERRRLNLRAAEYFKMAFPERAA